MKRILCILLCALLALAPATSFADKNKDNLPIGDLAGFEGGSMWFGEDFHYDITNEEACWELLQKPITVLDAEEKEAIYPLDAPNGEPVLNQWQGGFINGATAAVHVLGEDEDGWTLIEGVDYYNRVIRGYVRTKLLKTVTPNEKYGVIIDKLTQRLYVFIDGKLWDSCLISTGLPNDEQPYNETAAGEYMICSWVGDFDSEGMVCATALRFNGGDMIHEVPHNVRADGTKSYRRWEALLGQKASHGCVRTQRIETEKGLNARWLWDNLKKGTKVVIWDDGGRKMPYPDDEKLLFYNENGGSYYHLDQYCSSVKDKYLPLAEFAYGRLDSGEFLSLSACATCAPPRRKSQIAAENLKRGVITQEEYEAALTPIPYPAEDSLVYYNPKGGKNYHSDENCKSVKDRFLPLTGFAYGKLDTGDFAKLTPCKTCERIYRKAEIDELNIAMGLSAQTVKAMADAVVPLADEPQPTPFVNQTAEEPTDYEMEVTITIRD